MELRDNLVLRGLVEVNTFWGDLDLSSTELCDLLDGRWPGLWRARHRDGHMTSNLVTNVGRQQMTKLIVAESTVGVGFVALSTSVVTPALTDLSLPNEISRKTAVVKQSISTYYQRYVGYFTTTDFNSTGVNAGGLNDTASTGGNMFAEASLSLSKPNTTSATVDWRIFASTG